MLAEVQPVAARFIEAGYSIYLVGGVVRDLTLGAPMDELDFDLTTNARPDDIRRLVGPIADEIWAQGERFGTIGCRVAGREYEITTHRAEWYSDGSRKPQVVFGDEVEVDLSRRDFTINAMAIEIPSGRLVDPFGGEHALDARRLDTPVDPQVSFTDDPLRILRAARFIARYGLMVAPGVAAAASTLAHRLEIVSAERIRDELDKLLSTERPSAGLAFLTEVGALAFAAPFLSESIVVDLADALDRAERDLLVRRTILFTPCEPDDRRRRIERLRYSTRDQRAILGLLRATDTVGEHAGAWRARDVRAIVDLVGYEAIASLLSVLVARDADRATTLREAFHELDRVEDLRSFAPSLGGEDVMALLGVDSGPDVGRALAALRARRIDIGPTTADDERNYLREWYTA